MNKAKELIDMVEDIPKNAKVGKKYAKVLVDGETFRGLTLINLTNDKLIFKSATEDELIFNPFEQKIILK